MKKITILIILVGAFITSCGLIDESKDAIKLTSENFVYEPYLYESSLKIKKEDLLQKLIELKKNMENSKPTPSMEQQYKTYSTELDDVNCALDENCDDKPTNPSIGAGFNGGIVKPPLPPCKISFCEGSKLEFIVFPDYILSYHIRIADPKGKTIKTIKSNLKALKGYNGNFNYMELSLKGIPEQSVIHSIAEVKGYGKVTYTTVKNSK